MKNLDETQFVRHKLFAPNRAKWKQYADFVIGDKSLFSLLNYEVRVLFFGSIPGALGLVLRKKFYRNFFRQAGKNVIIGRNVIIRHGDKVELGDNVVLDDGCIIDGRGAVDQGVVIGSSTIIGRHATVQSKVGSLVIGENCNIGADSIVISQGGIEIDDWTQIAGGCKVAGGRFKIDPEMTEGVPITRFSLGSIAIGKGCFLGSGAQITDAVKIGQFCAIGAGAIVMQNIPDFSVYMSRPGMIMGTTKTSTNNNEA